MILVFSSAFEQMNRENSKFFLASFLPLSRPTFLVFFLASFLAFFLASFPAVLSSCPAFPKGRAVDNLSSSHYNSVKTHTMSKEYRR